MKFKEYMNEEYLTRIKGRKAMMSSAKSLEIFVNPSMKDLRDIKSNFIRFIADVKKKHIYVWDGHLEVHSFIWKGLVEQGYEKGNSVYGPDHLLAGYAKKRSGNLYVDHETFNCKNTDFEKYDWKWIDKYVKDFTKEMNMNEEYFMRVKNVGGQSTEVFVNPSSRDLKELDIKLRYLVSAKSKRVYVWNAKDTLHYDVFKKLKKDGEEYGRFYDPVFISGFATNKRNNIEIIRSIEFGYFAPKNYEYNWKFADKYIKGFTSLMKKHKEKWYV